MPRRSLFLVAPSLAAFAVAALAGCGRVPDPPSKASGPTAARAANTAEPAPIARPPQAKYQRDLYGKLDDCVADWGLTLKCVPLAGDASERTRGATFMGPIYSNALRFEAQMTTRREAVEQGYAAQLDESPGNRAIATSDVRS